MNNIIKYKIHKLIKCNNIYLYLQMAKILMYHLVIYNIHKFVEAHFIILLKYAFTKYLSIIKNVIENVFEYRLLIFTQWQYLNNSFILCINFINIRHNTLYKKLNN